MNKSLSSTMSESCNAQETIRRGRMGRRMVEYEDDREFKSKNLHAERKRRAKLSDRLLTLRSLVPIINNMNKATILEDAISYIEKLKEEVDNLSDELLTMEALSRRTEELVGKTSSDDDDEIVEIEEKMKQCVMMEEVQVINVDENKVWIKIILEKGKGRFTKLLQGMNYLGLELIDANVSTSKGVLLVSSCVQGTYGDILAIEHTKELLLEIMRGI